MNVLFIDNFDSFTYNLVDEFRKRGADVRVWRNTVAAEDALAGIVDLAPPRLIVLSPGPSTPMEAGCCIDLVRLAAEKKIPLFGVCLGHQAIVEAFGGTVGRAERVMHGKTSMIEHNGTTLFRDLPSPMRVGRYHSLVAGRLPAPLRETARSGNYVMAIEHEALPVIGVQFHPESILTPDGGAILDRVVDWAAKIDI
ncbi:MAG: anthranilate synthase component [Verrucomicrobiota bacterium]|jgi:anthranilate synthase component 2